MDERLDAAARREMAKFAAPRDAAWRRWWAVARGEAAVAAMRHASEMAGLGHGPLAIAMGMAAVAGQLASRCQPAEMAIVNLDQAMLGGMDISPADDRADAIIIGVAAHLLGTNDPGTIAGLLVKALVALDRPVEITPPERV